MENPYLAPRSLTESHSLKKRRRITARTLALTLPVTTLVGVAFGGLATFIVWTIQVVHPLDRWYIFWVYLLFGAIAGFIGGVMWIIGLMLRQRFTRPPT